MSYLQYLHRENEAKKVYEEADYNLRVLITSIHSLCSKDPDKIQLIKDFLHKIDSK